MALLAAIGPEHMKENTEIDFEISEADMDKKKITPNDIQPPTLTPHELSALPL
ncbi:hypothetical protein GIX79_10475 [Lactobacillus reuteri]|uniref:Uncharacterized protein n=1 Tax=Limosilactobacillus reuteri TaxID=1598 RepID=A0AAW9UCP7_LIMRT|nr:hypothetical protein [Limosilactobacillus reuteri]